MFNKKLLNVLVYILVVMVLVKLGLDLVLFVWTFWEVPAWVQNQTVGKVMNLLTNVGSVMFVYILLSALRSICMGPGSNPPPRPPMPFVRRPAPVHHTAKK